MKANIWTVGLVAGLSGFAAGLAISKAQNGQPLSSEKVLRLARSQASRSLPVSGAWICMTPQTIEQGLLTTDVYKGGMTATEDGNNRSFDFVADANTGKLIELRAQDEK